MRLYDIIKGLEFQISSEEVLLHTLGEVLIKIDNPIIKEIIETTTLAELLNGFEINPDDKKISDLDKLIDVEYLRDKTEANGFVKEQVRYIDNIIDRIQIYILESQISFFMDNHVFLDDSFSFSNMVVNRIPNNAKVQHLHGYLLFLHSMYNNDNESMSKAISAYERALKLGLDTRDFLVDYANALIKSKLYEQAETVLDKLSKENSHDPHFKRMKGEIFFDMDKVDEAIDCFLSSLELESSYKTSVHLGLCYRKKGDVANAVKYLKLGIHIAREKFGEDLDKLPRSLVEHYHIAKELLQ